MLAWESLVEAQALRAQGWSISAIARHVGVTRLTVRRYLNGERVPGQRARAVADPFEEFAEYCRRRLADDPHLWATTLFEEVVELGYLGSYPSFTRGIRTRGLRPRCAACAAAKTRDRALIPHRAGEETQWDWLMLPDPPAAWGWGENAHLLLGTLPHSSRWRAWLAEAEDQPHLIEGLHQVATRLGGMSKRWRFDRMATVCHPGSGRITASFGPVAVHYQVGISICPGYHPWRKGVVEKSAHTIAQRWWRTLPDDVTPAQAQVSLDRLCVKLDGRKRRRDGQPTTVGALADAEPLRTMPAPFPAMIEVERTVSNQALVAFRGNRYAVGPGHAGTVVAVRHKLGTTTLDISTGHGVLLAHHLRSPDGAGAVVRAEEHVTALTKVVLANFADREPCPPKTRRPPSTEALAEAERLRRHRAGDPAGSLAAGERVVVDFAAYAQQARPFGGNEQAGEQR
jgi:transposase